MLENYENFHKKLPTKNLQIFYMKHLIGGMIVNVK